ncbi:jg12733, partial [Pararge aegeria aegeria]
MPQTDTSTDASNSQQPVVLRRGCLKSGLSASRRPLRYAKLGGLNKTDVRDGVLYTIVHTFKHPLYDYSAQKHDIALLKLHTRVQLSVHIRPICLPVSSYHTHDSIRDIAGWGEVKENSESSEVLLT